MRTGLISVCFLLISCQLFTSREEEFGQVEIGMSKAQVIETLGSPSWSDRKNEEDRWIYFLDPHDRNSERIVYFQNNLVVRKGLRDEPALSAEERDSLKEPRPVNYQIQPRGKDELRKSIKKEVEKQTPPVEYKFEKI
jgi:outer membrane protein assembly factor BamE (lipoprotein component of BamABCDE complex)